MNVSGIGPSPAARTAAGGSPEERLRAVAKQLEGAFVEQLFKAMRETVPEGGITSGGGGEEMFSSMMDEHLAAQVPGGWDRGLGAAIVRQLRGALPAGESAPSSSPTVSGPEL